MGKFDILDHGAPLTMDKTKNYVKLQNTDIEEITDLSDLKKDEVGFIGHKANIHKAELTDRNISGNTTVSVYGWGAVDSGGGNGTTGGAAGGTSIGSGRTPGGTSYTGFSSRYGYGGTAASTGSNGFVYIVSV